MFLISDQSAWGWKMTVLENSPHIKFSGGMGEVLSQFHLQPSANLFWRAEELLDGLRDYRSGVKKYNSSKIECLRHTLSVLMIKPNDFWITIYRVNTKSSPPCDFCWYLSRECKFLHETLRDCHTIKYTLYHQVWLKYVGKWQIMLFQPTQPAFLSVRVWRRTDWTRTGSLRRLSGP